MVYVLIRVTDDEKHEVHRPEQTPRHRESQEHCNVLVLGQGDSIVGLNDQMSWTREVALLTDSPDMVNGAAQHFTKKRIRSVVELFRGSIHVHAIPMGHGNREGDAGPADIN